MATSVEDYESNFQKALSLQLSALRVFSKTDDPRAWGIVQHNLGCAYIGLSKVRSEEAQSIRDIRVRSATQNCRSRSGIPKHLQYWLASCRTLGEALLDLSADSGIENPDQYARRAEEVLRAAAARISAANIPISGPKFRISWRNAKNGQPLRKRELSSEDEAPSSENRHRQQSHSGAQFHPLGRATRHTFLIWSRIKRRTVGFVAPRDCRGA